MINPVALLLGIPLSCLLVGTCLYLQGMFRDDMREKLLAGGRSVDEVDKWLTFQRGSLWAALLLFPASLLLTGWPIALGFLWLTVFIVAAIVYAKL